MIHLIPPRKIRKFDGSEGSEGIDRTAPGHALAPWAHLSVR